MPQANNIVADLAYGPLSVPPGSVVDHITVSCVGAVSGPLPAQSVPPGTASVTFSSVPADSWTISAQAFPAIGAGYGTPVSTTLTTTAAATTIQVPVSISASQP